MRKWLPALPLLIVVALTALAYRDLPPLVQPAWQYLLPIEAAAESMPRAVFVLLIPGMAAAVWVLLVLLARARPVGSLPERLGTPAIERFEPTYETVVLGVVSLFALMQITLLAGAAGWPSWTHKAVGVTLGAGLFLVGNLMPRVRPNWIVGVRTKATLGDPELWMRTHRYFGMLLMLSGLAVLIIALVATRFAFATLALGFLLSALLAHLWAGSKTTSITAAIAGLLIVLVGAKLQAQMAPPAEAPLDIAARQITLPGTLTLPANPRPDVVVIVAGSGPTDRNGNGPLVQTDLYRQIAHALARGGIASLRYDKRGIGPTGMTLDHTNLSVDDYVGDVTAAVDGLIADGRFGRVFLLGHSEGAMHVVLAANRGARVGGVIILAGTGRKLADVLHDQFSLATDAATVARIDSAFALFIRGGNPVDAPAIAAPVLVPTYRRMLASMAAYDPAKEIASLSRPPLVITGSMDLQTTRKDFDALRASRPDGEFLLIEHANHVFKRADSLTPALQQATYHDPALPIVPELAPALIQWIRRP